MEIEFLLGPAGSGKTFRCLNDVRAALRRTEGAPLLFLAPKQATFQLERQLLNSEITGYTRLHILSFERLAEFVFEQLDVPVPPLLAEEGRVMVLRALLEQRHTELDIFHGSARRPGFARQLSRLLRELQNHRVGGERLRRLSEQVGPRQRLNHKLRDLATLLEGYLHWLDQEKLLDADRLLDLAADALREHPARERLQIEALWLDGFAQMTPQERTLLGALLPRCQRATLAFCLDSVRATSWYSPWALVSETVRHCQEEFATLGARLTTTVLPRDGPLHRFADSPALQHLEAHWANPVPQADEPAKTITSDSPPSPTVLDLRDSIRIVQCSHPEAEASFVAREILRSVRAGGRYRETAVLVRNLDQYHDPIRRVFRRYEIPLFVDRREPVAHHPLADLTRNALKAVAFGWQQRDWFGALKSGLVWREPVEIDRLENLAYARGWEGAVWREPLRADPDEAAWLEPMRVALVTPFASLADALGPHPSGKQLAEAILSFWQNLDVAKKLERWSQAAELTDPAAASVHATVWHQMQEWLDNLGRAFAHQSMPLSRWLPIVEAGLEGLTIGVIPPVLDQVLLGAIDRSRNPDLQQVFLLGVNEGVFPAPPPAPALLSAADRQVLEQEGCDLGPDLLEQLGHERFYGYIACTRARRRVVITAAARDNAGTQLNPSPFFQHLLRLFPTLEPEVAAAPESWLASEHASELIGPLLIDQARQARGQPATPGLAQLQSLAPFQETLERLRHLHATQESPRLDPAWAARLYGQVLHTSVSSLEKFASCPFRFFVDSGLKAKERDQFILDVRQQGSFQHEVLARFHQRVVAEHGAWRKLSPEAAGQLIRQIAYDLIPEFEHGILMASDQNYFQAQTFAELLGQFMEVIVDWFSQYQFDPAEVELPFGDDKHPLPGWQLDLGNGHTLMFHGRIDRIDLWRQPNSAQAACVVIDYKSSLRTANDVLLREGIQLQLPVYLNVLKQLPDPAPVFGVKRLIPAGVFYINIRGKYKAAQTRPTSAQTDQDARKKAYEHQGLFNISFLPQLDNRGETKGDQFKYVLKRSGDPRKNSQGRLSDEFEAMLRNAAEKVIDFGRRIYAGEIAIDPYRFGQEEPCRSCDFRSICRIDPWEHRYRVLPGR